MNGRQSSSANRIPSTKVVNNHVKSMQQLGKNPVHEDSQQASEVNAATRSFMINHRHVPNRRVCGWYFKHCQVRVLPIPNGKIVFNFYRERNFPDLSLDSLVEHLHFQNQPNQLNQKHQTSNSNRKFPEIH